MRVMDRQTEEIFVARDRARSLVEVLVGETATGPRVIRLTREEARRLAALILFQAARLDRPSVGRDRQDAGYAAAITGG